MIGSARGHHHSFREDWRGRRSPRLDVSLGLADRLGDLTSALL